MKIHALFKQTNTALLVFVMKARINNSRELLL